MENASAWDSCLQGKKHPAEVLIDSLSPKRQPRRGVFHVKRGHWFHSMHAFGPTISVSVLRQSKDLTLQVMKQAQDER